MDMSDKKLDYDVINGLKKKYGDYVVMVSRLAYPHKDHYTVISSMRILKEKYGKRHKLLLVGDGPEKDNLISFCLQNNMSEDVVFVGSKKNVQDYYSGAIILAHASVAGEGLPTVLLEAMDLGIPVVCTDSKVGPREILGNSKYGILTRVQDPEDMAKKINELLEDKEMYEHYRLLGKERMKDFSNDAIKDSLSECLSTLK